MTLVRCKRRYRAADCGARTDTHVVPLVGEGAAALGAPTSRNCTLSWAGAVRGYNNADRYELNANREQRGLCVEGARWPRDRRAVLIA